MRAGDWIANRTLAELSLRDEGVAVLGIDRADASRRGRATGAARIRPGDTLIVYGCRDRVCDLDARPAGQAGDLAHEAAVRGKRNASPPGDGSLTPVPGRADGPQRRVA